MSGTRLRSTRDESLCVGAEDGDGVADGAAHVADEQHQAGQQAAHVGDSIGSVAGARALGQIGLMRSGRAQQRGDVVGQDFGRDVDQQGVLRQARDGFELEAVLEPFEGLLDAPSPVVELGKQLGREGFFVQVGGQNADLPLGAIWRTRRSLGATAGQPQSATSSARGLLIDTQACESPERRKFLAAVQPLVLSQRTTKRMLRALSSAMSQAAG